jgi:hypothetical protein
MSDPNNTPDNAQQAESTPGADETVCYMCRKVIKSNAWTCPYCGKIFEKMLLSTLTLNSLSGAQKEAFSKGYQDCRIRWKETRDISLSISNYKPSRGYENAYRAGWKRASDELEIRGEPTTPRMEGVRRSQEEEIRKHLRRSAPGFFIVGVIHFRFSSTLSPIWGSLLMVLGFLNLFIARRAMVAVNGGALIAVGLWNIVLAGSEYWAYFGVMQIGWGLFEFLKFFSRDAWWL